MNTATSSSTRIGAAITLILGIMVIASASILIRYAQADNIPSLVIAAARLGISASVLSLIVAWRRQIVQSAITPRHAGLALVSGTCLAIHFATWIQSLAYTTVASSAALVATTPLWVGLAARLLLKESLNRWRIVGMALTIAGSILIAISDQQQTNASNPLLGNGLALLGAISGSAYFLVGRSLRNDIPLLSYIWMTYGCAAVVLLGASMASGNYTLPSTARTWLILAALAVGPQLLGHTSINYAMRHLSALLVTIALLGEPVGSAVLAFFLFHERIAPLQLTGLIGLLIGIGATAIGETREGVPT
ncbi:MAG: DMT family transporter [Chloroflexia bacterium]|nr:DMT family transporter [Chloroflexia bacterium]